MAKIAAKKRSCVSQRCPDRRPPAAGAGEREISGVSEVHGESGPPRQYDALYRARNSVG